jgi:hypothetical protein
VADDPATGGTGDVTFEKTITALDDNQQFLIVNATDVTRFEDNVGTAAQRLESLTTDAAPLAPSGITQFGRPTAGTPVTLTSAGPQLYRDGVLLNVHSHLVANEPSLGSIVFEQSVNDSVLDEHQLFVNAETFIDFRGDVGTVTRLDHLFAQANTGNISLREIRVQDSLSTSASSGIIELHANRGKIIDLNGIAGLMRLNALGHSLIATARDGIELDTEMVRLLQVKNANDGVNPATLDVVIRETNALAVREIVNEGRDVFLLSSGNTMTIEAVPAVQNSAKNNFIVGVGDLAAGLDDDIAVSGNIRADNAVSLIAGDDVTLDGTSNVRALNLFVYIKLDAGDADAAGGTVIFLGAIQGSNSLQYPIVAQGGSGNDLFSIQKFTNSPIAILAESGTLDNTFILMTDAAEQVSAFATIVQIAGQHLITYVGNEQLDIVGLGGDDKYFVQMPELVHGILANIVRLNGGEGEDEVRINGSTLPDVIRAGQYTTDANYRFQLLDAECLRVFGRGADDILENSAIVSSLLDGGFGNDHITGGNVAVNPAPGGKSRLIYDVIFGGPGIDTIIARAGDDYLFPDHLFDENTNTAVQTVNNGDVVDGGFGFDLILSLGFDTVNRGRDDRAADRIIGEGLSLNIVDFLNARFTQPTPQNVAAALLEGIGKICKKILVP